MKYMLKSAIAFLVIPYLFFIISGIAIGALAIIPNIFIWTAIILFLLDLFVFIFIYIATKKALNRDDKEQVAKDELIKSCRNVVEQVDKMKKI